MQGTLDLSRPFHDVQCGGTTDLCSLMHVLDEFYCEPDPRLHELHGHVKGLTQLEGSAILEGKPLPLDQPCDELDFQSPLCRVLAAVACHTEPALHSRLGPDTTYGHIAWHTRM